MVEELESDVSEIVQVLKNKEAYCYGCGSCLKSAHLLVCAECLDMETTSFLKLASDYDEDEIFVDEEDEDKNESDSAMALDFNFTSTGDSSIEEGDDLRGEDTLSSPSI